MPIYEYRCEECGDESQELRPMRNRNKNGKCHCSSPTIRIASMPAMHVWATARDFPNLGKAGDGAMRFETKGEYESYLTQNNIGEVSTSAPIERPHGNKVVMTDG